MTAIKYQLERLAYASGRLLLAGHHRLYQPGSVAATEKIDGTLITTVDTTINRWLARWAKRERYGFVGEEGNGALDKTHVLLADPVDGTTAFTRGMNTATIILTLMRMQDGHGYPMAAVIRDPLSPRQWSTTKGDGVWFGRARECGKFVVSPLAKHTTGRIRSHICVWPGAGYNLATVRTAMLADRRFDDQQMGAVGISAGLIASGLLDLCLFGPSSAVEAAAMSLIVTNAGGVACDLRGEPLTRGFAFGEVRGKPDFELPHGAIFAANQEVADVALAYVAKHN